jgi:hypothetical protein
MQKFGKSVLLTVITTTVSICFASENLLKNGNFKRGTNNWIGSTFIVENNGKNMLELNPKFKFLKSRQKLPVNPDKVYQLSGRFSAKGNIQQILFGVIPFDKNGRFINSRNTSNVVGSETVLAQACTKGQVKVKVKDASKWKKGIGTYYIAFKTDNTGAFKDIPNFRLMRIKNIKKITDCWEITLNRPICWNFPAGTTVRQHLSGSTYLYCGGVVRNLKGSKLITGTICGTGNAPHEAAKWRPGTAYAQVMVLVIFKAGGEGKLLVSDLKFEETVSKENNIKK